MVANPLGILESVTLSLKDTLLVTSTLEAKSLNSMFPHKGFVPSDLRILLLLPIFNAVREGVLFEFA